MAGRGFLAQRKGLRGGRAAVGQLMGQSQSQGGASRAVGMGCPGCSRRSPSLAAAQPSARGITDDSGPSSSAASPTPMWKRCSASRPLTGPRTSSQARCRRSSRRPISARTSITAGSASSMFLHASGRRYRTTVNAAEAPIRRLWIGLTIPTGSHVHSVTLERTPSRLERMRDQSRRRGHDAGRARRAHAVRGSGMKARAL
jgi:hypothetical protein